MDQFVCSFGKSRVPAQTLDVSRPRFRPRMLHGSVLAVWPQARGYAFIWIPTVLANEGVVGKLLFHQESMPKEEEYLFTSRSAPHRMTGIYGARFSARQNFEHTLSFFPMVRHCQYFMTLGCSRQFCMMCICIFCAFVFVSYICHTLLAFCLNCSHAHPVAWSTGVHVAYT